MTVMCQFVLLANNEFQIRTILIIKRRNIKLIANNSILNNVFFSIAIGFDSLIVSKINKNRRLTKFADAHVQYSIYSLDSLLR